MAQRRQRGSARRPVGTRGGGSDLGDDIIWGVDGPTGIAAYLNIKPTQAYYLISRGKLPVRRLGHRTITASRSELRNFFRGLPAER